MDWIAASGIGHVNQVRQQARAFDVAQELNTQAVAEVSAFDQARDVGDDEALRMRRPVAAREW